MTEKKSYEQLDLFYLGREVDPESGQTTPLPLLYKNKHLTTHAAIIGMTGSGKTGLGIALLEEAALDRLPAIVIDPKGDMTNLLLSFPELRSEDFLPWMDAAKAEQKNISLEELAAQTAATWREGIQSWDQDGERIRTMHSHADFSLYTPGAAGGRPVSVLGSLDAPEAEVVADADTVASLVNSTVSSLLGLIGLQPDPLKSREHILLSSLILHHWRRQEDITLEGLISEVVNPPFGKVGVFPLDTFYPQKQRLELAMQLNNIIASPAFSGWIQGEPLQVENFLYTREGKPRISIFTIAHLSDEERMFFVTMLLGRLISWMRRQEGSSGLRCLLYMDEIFGYFPPTANPPSKKPMLLLLKQARAYGLGVVLSTQNPVDLDYKGLANIGTWFVGRLQTRQDQERVMAGIAGSSERFDERQIRSMLADMRGRTFLMYSAHLDEPVLFETRWVLSYLRGPISLAELEPLLAERPEPGQRPEAPAAGTGTERGRFSRTPPVLPARITQCFVPPPVPMEEVRYVPWLAGWASVRFYDQRRGVDQVSEVCFRLPLAEETGSLDWEESRQCDLQQDELDDAPAPDCLYGVLPPVISGLTSLAGPKKEFADFLYHSQRIRLWRVPELRLESRPGESEESFQQRLADQLREKKEIELARLTERLGKKQRQLENRLERALARVDKEKADVKTRGMDTALSFGVAVFGALFGRKPFSVTTASRSARGMRSAGRLYKEKQDVDRAMEEVERIEEELAILGRELEEKSAALGERFDPERYRIEPFAIKPRRSDIFSVRLCLLWEPDLDFLDRLA